MRQKIWLIWLFLIPGLIASGQAPFPPPAGFWWKMPDGRKILVWQSFPYWYGYNFFHEKDWRLVQAQASNTQFHTPGIGDIFKSDESSVRKARSLCIEKIKSMREEGYAYDFIAVSVTNQWRIDNDGPFPPLVDFIKKWNTLGLKPQLRLTTASDAMKRIEKKLGKDTPVFEGEWPDWWAFGGAAFPREMKASRLAGNYAEAALSPVWGGNSEKADREVESIERLLCRYYEHTFTSNKSSSDPYGLFNQEHLSEKNIYAYRPYEQAKWLLAQRIRNLFTDEPEGLYIINTGDSDYTGWIDLDTISFREIDYKSVTDTETGRSWKLYGSQRNVRFWVNGLKPHSFKRFLLSKEPTGVEDSLPEPAIEVDKNGWPRSIIWESMPQPLFLGDIGKFLSLESLVGRKIEPEIWNEQDSTQRSRKVKESTKQVSAAAQMTSRRETPFTLIFIQEFEHPRIKQGKRILEVWKNEPRISLDIHLNRLSSSNPEIFYIDFPLPEQEAFPVTSNGGEAFRPYLDQIPGTCTDFFTIDGWVNYPAPSGSWLWSSRDAVLVSFSSPQLAAKRLSPPAHMNKILAMVYNNMWEVNFLDDCPGNMEFHFDLVWTNREITPKKAAQITGTYDLPPAVMLNPLKKQDPYTVKHLNELRERTDVP